MARTATRKRKKRTVKTVKSATGMQSRLNSLRADFDALQHDVRGLASDVGDAASSQAKEFVNDAIGTATDTVDRVTEWGAENLDGVRTAVKTQPLAACMLSMSAGALIGALLLR
ncbi:MAG TPA: hypothetical protein VFW28_11210 [Micropepsaceae bacterium]|nr:hypothetical protein [Micropepsaceae bacterium]